MLNVKVWTETLSAWCVMTFVLCVGWCSIAPEGWHVRAFLESFLPGFRWLSVGSFLLGFVESALMGAYSGALLALIHNAVARSEHIEAHGVAQATSR